MFNKEKSVDYHAEQRTETTLSNKPTPEVKPKRTNRRFSASYKLRVLEEMDRATESGQKGEILRREGLYTSQIAGWCGIVSLPPKSVFTLTSQNF